MTLRLNDHDERTAHHRPSSWILGQVSYEGLDLKAAALLHAIVSKGPLVDGSKRLGRLAVAVFYQINGGILDAPDDPADDLVISVAVGSGDPPTVATRLAEWTRPARRPAVAQFCRADLM